MNVLNLIQIVNEITRHIDYLKQKTGEEFNVFEITGIASDEVKITRVIYELLSPIGSHGQKYLFLKLFLDQVLNLSIDNDELKTCIVEREYGIDSNRRIDLVIKTESKFIPIEVKIYASDQPKQCYDYYQVAKNSNLYYLTLFGNQPSSESASGLTKINDGYKEITLISFVDDISNWIKSCIKQSQIIRIAPIREVLMQFLNTIYKLTNQVEDEKMQEIKELLLNSSENMKSALKIDAAIPEAKKELMRKLFKAIENRVGLPKLNNECDYEFEDKIEKYYSTKTISTYPGISYLYKKDVRKNVDIWVRVEIDWKIYIGYCTAMNNKKIDEQILTEKEIRTIINVNPEIDKGWIYWEWLPSDEEEW